MNAPLGWLLITAGVALMITGSAMLRAASHRFRKQRPRSRWLADGLSAALTCTTVGGAVIAGVQWALLSQTARGAVWVVVLSLPAFLAAASVWRLLTVWRTVRYRRRGVRAVPSGRGWHR